MGTGGTVLAAGRRQRPRHPPQATPPELEFWKTVAALVGGAVGAALASYQAAKHRLADPESMALVEETGYPAPSLTPGQLALARMAAAAHRNRGNASNAAARDGFRTAAMWPGSDDLQPEKE